MDTLKKAEIASQTQKLELNETVDPADMRDDRIVDYTLNRRLFPVPLFPNHQSPKKGQYARISGFGYTYSKFLVIEKIYRN